MGSPFCSLYTEVLEVPGDPGATITVRKLAPKQLTAARAAAFDDPDRVSRVIDAMGGEAAIAVIGTSAAGTPATEAIDAAKSRVLRADPLLLYDAVTLIEAGVVTWSYPQPTRRESYEDLDEETQAWLARAVLRLAKPALFAASEADDAKNASGVSTAP